MCKHRCIYAGRGRGGGPGIYMHLCTNIDIYGYMLGAGGYMRIYAGRRRAGGRGKYMHKYAHICWARAGRRAGLALNDSKGGGRDSPSIMKGQCLISWRAHLKYNYI